MPSCALERFQELRPRVSKGSKFGRVSSSPPSRGSEVSLCRNVAFLFSAKVAKRAGDLAERRALRGFDAIHLASALEVEELTSAVPSFCCFDDRLREAAAAEGLPI